MRAGRLPALASLLLAVGCGGTEPRSEAVSSTTATTHAPAPTTEPVEPTPTAKALNAIPGVPRFVWPYRSWEKLNRKPVPARDADPHLGTKEVYASRADRHGTYPAGTVIVKEAVRPGADFVGLIAVMRKVEGADPADKNWVFVEYTRGAKSDPFGETASGAVCWSCHMGAADADYVWIAKLGLTR